MDLFQLDDIFEIYIPTARAINPVTNGNWEGTGVIPDVVVSADFALDTALVLARAAGREYREPRDAELASAVEQMERALARAEEAFRDGRDADGEIALDDFVEAGADHRLINEFFLSVLAYEYHADTERALLLAILERTVRLFPQSVEACETLATVLAGLGENQLARTYFLRALALDPEAVSLDNWYQYETQQPELFARGLRGKSDENRPPSVNWTIPIVVNIC